MSDLVSVLIPAWEESSVLGASLEKLNRVEYPNWEVILIAGGKDDTFGLAQRLIEGFSACPIQMIEQQPNGKNAALNLGLKQAKGSIIVIMDADTQVQPSWLSELLKPLANGYDAACGNYFPLHDSWVSALEQMEKIAAYQIHQSVILQGSGTIAIKRDVLEEVGGFPERVKVGVDYDLDMRVTKAGFRKAFAKDAVVYTHRASKLGEFWRNELRWRRAHLRLLLNQSFQPKLWLGEGLFYLVALGILGLVLATLLSLIFAQFGFAAFFLMLLVLTLLFFLARRSTLALEVARFTGEKRYLKLVWIPAFFLLLSYLAAWRAMLTLKQNTVHFKGQRS